MTGSRPPEREGPGAGGDAPEDLAPPDLLRTTAFGPHQVPGIWRRMLPEELFWMRPPREVRVTCDRCTKVALGDFDPGCQCCTYFPQIPNFMVGLALRDPRTRPHVEALIAGGYALPRGTIITPARFKETLEAYAAEGFGRDPRIRCPFFSQRSRQCAIYPFRNSICCTFFCANDHGAAGEEYWTRVQGVAGHVESVLAIWAAGQLGVDQRQYVARLDALARDIPSCSASPTSGWSARARRLLWGEWLGREGDFFLRCADLIIEHLDRLYDIAINTPYSDSLAFEQAVQGWLPAACRDELPPMGRADSDYEELPSLWYKLQLCHRRLWELPFGERAILAPGAALSENPLDDAECRASAHLTHLVTLAGERRFLSPEEAAVLGLFNQPQELGEALLEGPELARLEQPREFLAICFRRGILHAVEGCSATR